MTLPPLLLLFLFLLLWPLSGVDGGGGGGLNIELKRKFEPCDCDSNTCVAFWSHYCRGGNKKEQEGKRINALVEK